MSGTHRKKMPATVVGTPVYRQVAGVSLLSTVAASKWKKTDSPKVDL